MFDYTNYQVLLACGATDMRKSINGLCEIVQLHFSMDPCKKIIFVFCNGAKNRIKLLVWEGNGFWVHFKRIEKGTVLWPETSENEITMDFTESDLMNLINTPGLKQKIKRKEIWKNR